MGRSIMMFRPLPVLSFFSLISLVVLILLGNWQYERYTGKLDQPGFMASQPVVSAVELRIHTDNPGYAQNVYGVADGEPLWRRYVPGRLIDTNELVIVLWDATGGPQPQRLKLSELQPDYSREANVFIRDTKPGAFALPDDPDQGIWHTFDADAIARQLGYEVSAPVRVVETLALTVRNSEDMSRARRTENPYAFQEVIDPLPPERHFGYALTWWGMAIGLIGVYVVFHHSQGRLRFRS